MGLCRFLWRHKRAIATTSVVAVGGYCAYRLYQKKRELDDLIDSLGLQQLFGEEGSGAARQSKEERWLPHHASPTAILARLVLTR